MKSSLLIFLLLVVLPIVLSAPQVLGKEALSDTELDEIGAGGHTSAHRPPGVTLPRFPIDPFFLAHHSASLASRLRPGTQHSGRTISELGKSKKSILQFKRSGPRGSPALSRNN